MQENKNILLATFLSALVLISWTWFYEKPRLERLEAQKKIAIEQNQQKEPKIIAKKPSADLADNKIAPKISKLDKEIDDISKHLTLLMLTLFVSRQLAVLGIVIGLIKYLSH